MQLKNLTADRQPCHLENYRQTCDRLRCLARHYYLFHTAYLGRGIVQRSIESVFYLQEVMCRQINGV